MLRLKAETETAKGNFAGWIEEVDTGNELCFRSTPELLNFLAQRFDEANSAVPAAAAQDHKQDATTTSKPRRDSLNERKCADTRDTEHRNSRRKN